MDKVDSRRHAPKDTPDWVPSELIKQRWPEISLCSPYTTFVTPVGGHHEATFALYGLSDARSSDLQLVILEAAYGGIISPADNISLNFIALQNYRSIAIEYPVLEEPIHDKVPRDLLRAIQAKVPVLKDFKEGYYMPTSFVTGPDCFGVLGVYVGNMREKATHESRLKVRYPVGKNVVAMCYKAFVNHYWRHLK